MSIKNLPFILYFLALFAYHIGLFGEAAVESPSINGSLRHFNELFSTDSDGNYVTQQPMQIGNVMLGQGVALGNNVQVGGVRLAELEGRTLRVSQSQDGVIVQL